MSNVNKLKEIASQLRSPFGKKGIEIGNMMNEINFNMTINSIKNLKIRDNDKVLELGHGNCGHLKLILDSNKNIQYHGLETSKLMYQESVNNHRQHIESKMASFHMYDGINIPFDLNYFDKIFTVNTIYFWENPVNFINKVYKITKDNGLFCITFAHKEFMSKIPFTKFNFNLYSLDEAIDIVEQTHFKTNNIDTVIEKIKDKKGNLIDRGLSSIVLKK